MVWKRLVSALGGGGRRPLTPEAIQQAFAAAVQCLQAGDRLGAEEAIHAAVEQAAAEVGKDSPLYAQALFQEATVLAGCGDLVRAAAACRAAAAVPAPDRAARKERLTYLMNLGEILTRLGQLDEAERVLRDSLEERKAFYGAEHPGYAYGLGSLADLLLARGNAREALDLGSQAVTINGRAGNPQVASDLALRTYAVKAVEGPGAAGLEGWEGLPAELRGRVIQHCLERAERAPAPVALAVLQELRQRLRTLPDVDATTRINVTIAVANTARLAGDHAARIEAGREVVGLSEQLGDRRQLAMAYQGLAHALADAGQVEETEQAYRSALEVARGLGDRKLAANALRNEAIWLNERGLRDRADATHRRAVEEAAASGDRVMHGRALTAYGIFLQHGGDLPRARQLLEQALALLPPAEPDAFYAQNHLNALKKGEGCGCGAGDEALSALLQRLVQERAPEGLLESVTIRLRGEEAPEVDVRLKREPTEEELGQLNRVVNQTLAEMRENYRKAGYGR